MWRPCHQSPLTSCDSPSTHAETVVDGLREPFGDAPEIQPAAMIVPLSAFDRRGHRIGYGAGFYDRMLAGFGAAPPLTLGLAYECQYLAELPVDGHDQPLDLVLTESDLRRRRVHETR